MCINSQKDATAIWTGNKLISSQRHMLYWEICQEQNACTPAITKKLTIFAADEIAFW